MRKQNLTIKGCGRLAVLTALILIGCTAANAQDAASLKARHEAMREELANNAFRRPLFLESSETESQVKGDIYGRIAQPFTLLGPAMQDLSHWCELLILHINVKGCSASPPGKGRELTLKVGRKFDQPLEDAYHFQFRFHVVKSEADYLQIEMQAEDGPLGTKRYRMLIEIVALDSGQSFLHLAYTYEFGLAARLAMRGYLATIGRHKRGFSIVGRKPNGQAVYIDGTRGVIERNTMRYFVAIEAYLGALSTPAPQQLEKRLNDWYAGIERYPIQLHDLERGEYLGMKRKEVQRMNSSRADPSNE